MLSMREDIPEEEEEEEVVPRDDWFVTERRIIEAPVLGLTVVTS